MPVANQSSTLNAMMGAVQTVLTFATGLADDFVLEAYDDNPFRKGEPYQICYRLVDESPFFHPGAGRLCSPTFLVLEVRLFTRLVLDIAGGDPIWSRDTGRGALVMRYRIQDALAGKLLFASYDGNSGLPTGQFLTVEPLEQVQAPLFAKKDEKKDPTWGEHKLYFSFNAVQPLTN